MFKKQGTPLFWHPFVWRLWRTGMLLLTKSKGHTSNFHYSGFPNQLQTKSNLHISIPQSQILCLNLDQKQTPNLEFLICISVQKNNRQSAVFLCYTLLLNEGIPRALKGKKLRLKNILLLPLIFEEINSF
jgi:hypothetical protein